MLTLVFVETFDLHVENRIRVQNNAGVLFHMLSKRFFVVAFDALERFQNTRVVFVFAQLQKLVGVIDKAAADEFFEELRKLGVRLAQPAAVRNPVGDVFKLVGREHIEIVEHGFLEDFAVQRGNAVDGVRGRDAKIRHAYNAVGHNRHTLDLVGVLGRLPDEIAETVVDFFGNLPNSRH